MLWNFPRIRPSGPEAPTLVSATSPSSSGPAQSSWAVDTWSTIGIYCYYYLLISLVLLKHKMSCYFILFQCTFGELQLLLQGRRRIRHSVLRLQLRASGQLQRAARVRRGRHLQLLPRGHLLLLQGAVCQVGLGQAPLPGQIPCLCLGSDHLCFNLFYSILETVCLCI